MTLSPAAQAQMAETAAQRATHKVAAETAARRDNLTDLAAGDIVFLATSPGERWQRHGVVVDLWHDADGERLARVIYAGNGPHGDMDQDTTCVACGATNIRRWTWRQWVVGDGDIVSVDRYSLASGRCWHHAAQLARAFHDQYRTFVTPANNDDGRALLGYAASLIQPKRTT